MNEIKYIKATIQDIETVINLRIQFLTEFFGKPEVHVELDLRKSLNEYFKTSLPNNDYVCWFAISGEIPVGAGGMVIRRRAGHFKNISGIDAYIMSMYTLPDFRKKGICNTILNKLIESGKKMGISVFELHASEEGEPIYIKNGFEINKEPNYRKIIKVFEDDKNKTIK